MNAPASITVTPVFVADLSVEGERMPVYVHVIDHPDARVLVDTGMTELHPAMADMDPRLRPLSEQDFDLAGIDIVVNTHLHADHCGGNHLFAGKPIYVQRRELDDARSEDDYTIREWVEAPGVRYVPVDGEHELLPGLRLVPAPGHTPGMQMVVVETGGRPVIVGGDVAVWFGEFDEPPTEGRQRVLALDPELVWLTHEHEPWRPPTVSTQPEVIRGPLIAWPVPPRQKERRVMQFFLTVPHDAAEEPTMTSMDPAELEAALAAVEAFNTDLHESGAFRFAGGLHPPSSAKTVDATNGEPVVVDGPFVEAPEYVGGFWVIEAADQDAAVRWATQASKALGGRIEVRAFQDPPDA